MDIPRERPFSLRLFIAIICGLSWPFQFVYVFGGDEYRPVLLLSMIMVLVGTYISGMYVFKDGFANAGWHWGKPRQYAWAFGFAAFLWLVPSVIEQVLGFHSANDVPPLTLLTIFSTNFLVTLIPAFSEEFGWRGYMLPRLLKQYTVRTALLLHGFVTWFWHLPVIIVMGLHLQGNPFVTVPLTLGISLIPTVMHAVVFAYFWSRSQSLAVSTVYHSAFDEVRDTLSASIGFGPLPEIWQMTVLTIVGVTLLVKTTWLKSQGGEYTHG